MEKDDDDLSLAFYAAPRSFEEQLLGEYGRDNEMDVEPLKPPGTPDSGSSLSSSNGTPKMCRRQSYGSILKYPNDLALEEAAIGDLFKPIMHDAYTVHNPTMTVEVGYCTPNAPQNNCRVTVNDGTSFAKLVKRIAKNMIKHGLVSVTTQLKFSLVEFRSIVLPCEHYPTGENAVNRHASYAPSWSIQNMIWIRASPI